MSTATIINDIPQQHSTTGAAADKNSVANSSEDVIMGISKSMLDNMTKVLAELLATGLLIFFGCMGCIGFDKDKFPPTYIIAINVGLTVMFVIQIFGCVSGAHINPCVTIAAVIYKLISVPLAAAYFLAQFLGAYLGFGLLKLLTPTKIWNISDDGICTTRPMSEMSNIQAFMIEYLATTVLIFVCCAVWDPRNARNTDTIPIRFGLTVASISIVTLQYTGGSMNPVRSIAPELWSERVDKQHWIYWVAPISSSIITSLIYKYLFRRDAEQDSLERVEHLLLEQREKC